MKVLVTGGAGYIGSVCVEALLAAGHGVTVLDDLSEGHRSAVDSRAVFIKGSLGDRGSIQSALNAAKPEVIIHLAANALVGESMREPGKYFRTNVAYGVELLEAAVRNGVAKFVFSSSCATYGPAGDTPITEETPQRPINPYGESKLMFERMLEWYRRIHEIEFVVFRYFNAAGASGKYGEHHRVETHLIPNVLKVALGQARRCEIFGTDYSTEDGTCVRDYVHVSDIAQAHMLAMEAGIQGFYNLGTGEGCSVRQVVTACEKISGMRIPAIEKPRRPGDPARLVASPEKAMRELGWTPKYSKIEDIVASAWDWHKRNPQGYAD